MSLRIGMLAPITHSYPPSGYGPWERVAHDLTEGLVETGHHVTLFAPESSVTSATLHATTEAPLSRFDDSSWRLIEDRHIKEAFDYAGRQELDLVHSHLHIHALSLASDLRQPLLTTLHGVAWNEDVRETLARHWNRPFVSLSNRERDFLPGLNYVATVPNGIRTDDFPVGGGAGEYLVFIGRLAPEKAPHLAIEVAVRSGRPLLIAGVIEERHRDYANTVLGSVGPGTGIDYLGSLQRSEISLLLRDAAATIMPLQWDEPFGLVIVESLSSGTPVVAWNRGAMPEIIEDEITGFLVDDVEAAVRAVERIEDISRARCAGSARQRFDYRVMTEAYLSVYQNLVNRSLPGVHSRTTLQT